MKKLILESILGRQRECQKLVGVIKLFLSFFAMNSVLILATIYPLCSLADTGVKSNEAADNGPRLQNFMLQYLPSNEYEDVWGLGWYSGSERSLGFYVNGQLTLQGTSGRDDYYDSLSVNSFGDPVIGNISDILIVNAGATFFIMKNIGIYAGIGYADVSGYAEKFDPLCILDSDCEYLVRDSSLDDSGLNKNLGVIIRLGRVAIEMGRNSFVNDNYFGVGFAF